MTLYLHFGTTSGSSGLFSSMPLPFWLGLVGLCLAIFLLWKVGVADRRSWIVERATPLPIGLVNPRDDVWVSGTVVCASPLSVPNFGHSCIYYDYREEERVTTSRGGASWRTGEHYSGRTEFAIAELEPRVNTDRHGVNPSCAVGHRFASSVVSREEKSIAVAAQEAEFDGLALAGPEFFGMNRRRSARYFPYPVRADAVGSVSEDRARLERYANIPLIVTTRLRQDYLSACEQAETWKRFAAAALLTLGVFGLLLGISLKLGFPSSSGASPQSPVAGPQSPWPNVLASLVLALLVFAVWWFGYAYNRLVLLRERVRTAWRQIDVDLKNRHDLIPELVSVIKGYAEHERELQELVARLQVGQARLTPSPSNPQSVISNPQSALPLADVWAVLERYPQLMADKLFAQLRAQLTALEDKIAFGRKFYNESVLTYSNMRNQFPTSTIEGLFRCFPPYESFSD